MMIATGNFRPALLPNGGTAVWNRQVQIVEDVTAAGLQAQINAFLTTLKTGPAFVLGAALLEIQFQRIGGSYTALLSYGFYSIT